VDRIKVAEEGRSSILLRVARIHTSVFSYLLTSITLARQPVKSDPQCSSMFLSAQSTTQILAAYTLVRFAQFREPEGNDGQSGNATVNLIYETIPVH
jgi:hypothetical protein